MNHAYYLVESGQTTGPHSLAVLRQKAEILTLTPASLVCPAEPDSEADNRWRPIHEDPALQAEVFPVRATPAPRLGKVSGEQINAHDDEASNPVDVMALLRDNAAHARAATSPGIPTSPKSSYRNRRHRDYLICALALTAFCAIAGAFIGYINPFLIALFVMGHIGLPWVLYGIMDRH